MSKSKIFIGISISFAVGVFAASVFRIPHAWMYAFFGIGVCLLAIAFYENYARAAVAALFLVCMACGLLRMGNSVVPSEFQEILDMKQQVEGHIVQDPDIRQNKQLLTVRPKGYSQNILVTTTLTNQYAYGDWVLVNGKIAEAKSFEDFDYKGYLERYNVYAVASYPKVLILKNNQGNFLKEKILKLKHAFVDRVSNFLQEPHRSLLLGILIGAKKSLPQDVVDNFNNTGTSHIIAISGFNITIIISALGFLARFLGRRASFWISTGIIVAFVILSGASASVIRAAIMGVLLLTSFSIGRQYAVGTALFFAGFVMLFLNPRILYWDIGFQLSFLATLGIVYFVPVLEKLTHHWPNPFELKNIFIVTMSAIAVTLPVILLDFGTLSLTAPLVNMLILPLVPLVMLLGFLTVLPFVGIGFAFADKFFLSYILSVTHFFAHVPYGTLTVKISASLAAALSCTLIALYFYLRRRASVTPPAGTEPSLPAMPS